MREQLKAHRIHLEYEPEAGGLAALDQVLARLDRAITSAQVARVLVEGGRRVASDASGGALVVPTPDRAELRVRYTVGDVDGALGTGARLPLSANFPLCEAVRTRQEVWLSNPDELAQHFPDSTPSDDSRAWAVLPLQLEGVMLGAVGWRLQAPRLSAHVRACLRALAEAGGAALYRAGVFDSERTARMQAELGSYEVALQDRMMAAVSATLDSVVTTSSVSQTLDRIAHLTLPRLGEWSSIETLDDHGRPRHVAAAHTDPGKERLLRGLLPPGTTWGHRLLRTRQDAKPLLISSIGADSKHLNGLARRELQALRMLGIEQLLVLPLRIHGQTFGMISFGSSNGAIRYSPAVVAVAERVARRCAAWLEYMQLHSMAERANQAREDFVAATSHELRTPLSHIKGFVSTLRTTDTVWDASTRDDFLAEIEQEADRLALLVETLLDLSRIDSGALEDTQRAPNPPATLIAAGIDRVRPTLRDRPIDMDLAADLPRVWADASSVERVIANLLDNAAKYSPQSEPITIVARVTGASVTFRVEDRGLGIPDHHMERIFEPFFREPTGLYPAKPGAGLGLAICRSIIRSQRGRIWAEHRPGGGAVIAFTLPIAAGSQGM